MSFSDGGLIGKPDQLMSALLFLNLEIAQFSQAQFRSQAVFRPKWNSRTDTCSPEWISSQLIVENHT